MAELLIITPANADGVVQTKPQVVWRRQWWREACAKVLLSDSRARWQCELTYGVWFMRCPAFMQNAEWAVFSSDMSPVLLRQLTDHPVELRGDSAWLCLSHTPEVLSGCTHNARSVPSFGPLVFTEPPGKQQDDRVITNSPSGWPAFRFPAIINMAETFHTHDEIILTPGAWLIP